ncbi:hypothetical protein C4J89_2025 [Pseudomonas sp. R4-35-07]|nr:hypothetical protein C4J92_2010 [Pseudomonas sp. R3-18-08]AZF20805.1 hypothetical protein C4J91_2055 [Pseudomonas sp. R3-52-08]AZF26136.1 hypothetical protein C4J90_1963 [Pseudomonas sp. R2-60-08W]AZF31500.1 hypothetical protein C4J89_2025 [Pseudomonas sp. R4-35-07]AZF36778.1 hypothetical protein C4J88_1995 [Pseudomonas sp. R4-39-08]AZF52444.1 hypothetical protein C4J85_1959 [Pseudomonas sp. R4-34-07]MDQ0980274.1 putative RNA-binding Zn-ribbon protein involved in translation (DUF1610 famil
MFANYDDHKCIKCDAPLELGESEVTYMVPSASEQRCPKCRRKYSVRVMNTALSQSVKRMYIMVDNRKN